MFLLNKNVYLAICHMEKVVKLVTKRNASLARMTTFSTHKNVSFVSQHTEKAVISVTKRNASLVFLAIL